jgi:xanthine dehydrogenase YagT iron-sulfur-binding subunit
VTVDLNQAIQGGDSSVDRANMPHSLRALLSTSAGELAPRVSLTALVNGRETTIFVEPRTTLLDALREHLHLTGTKKGCDRGEWGACTVHVNGRRILSCLSLAVMHEGAQIRTINDRKAPVRWLNSNGVVAPVPNWRFNLTLALPR